MTIDEIIKAALAEDVGNGDHTSLSTIPQWAIGRANLLIKENGILCGVDIARKVFNTVDPDLDFQVFIEDGNDVVPGDIVFSVSGKVISILTGERLALNFMQRLSGIATNTRLMVNELKGTKARLLDTRKTTPNFRELEKMAVRTGGGENHRMGLYDMILIKDNHVDFAGGIKQAIKAVHNYIKDKALDLKIEIEVRNFDELNLVMETGGVDRIMLDNFNVSDLKKAVELVAGRFETEASGNITLKNIREYAKTGVDFISSGQLTHQIRSLDMSLKADF
ncbi:MAG TPA: carboxylating nicotinate-nucleotide diphosphorylase [Bacteroidales bacterium]|jgi:nicotinate-nucleotide pyrophosphorylase (carboxylating)|nr:carboxylating nicotinate-nucleotide diphosphorylase [Bacteroidales bacterium]OQC36520.1 MAG: Nicotinate-nucleotide pyrophosphorylase (carboxylating) [Bacteroidetes bacterium ADurb.Bin041]MBP7873290.1 carboxylating nicotinate-nucleotide diphosphorylase [Bacteroidales bacterium]MCZ2283224.1 carboxylating nicotinate-nucleotide diphosphorylase [Bacteroidales bacterium]HNV50136.1 carboxylating nicotinate-nucleotide diphosphorylase [Bacteroidales bacterium]